MLNQLFKITFILLLFQSNSYSKNYNLNDFDAKNFSRYFSGIIAFENKKNSDALKFFQTSKILSKQHNPYLKRYVNTLVIEKKIQRAINEIKKNENKKNSNFFEAYLILTIDSIKKNNYEKANQYILKASKLANQDRLQPVIIEVLKELIYVFNNKKILNKKKNYGNISIISETFQRCFLNDQGTESFFLKIIDNNKGIDFSRYTFFYINYLIENERLKEAQIVSNKLNVLNTTLLLSQGKSWIERNQYSNFTKIFTCKNTSHVTSEILFLISNLYASQDIFQQSNFYLNLSYFLNTNFLFNLSLLAENHFLNGEYEKTKQILFKFNEEDEFYYWFRIKKEAQIISKEKNSNQATKFIGRKFEKIINPNLRMIYDLGNFYKNSKEFKKAIEHYNIIIPKIREESELKAKILYRRGGSYERLGNFDKADEDLLRSLKIKPDDAYVLNYLAYSWLERNHKINQAFEMLKKAYSLESDDPYIIDSIGWAYFLVDDYVEAEKYLKRAIELMPDDPIVNDHYGDILWKLEKKLQATYFWKAVLEFEETEQEMRDKINEKLINGLKNS